jgi:ribosomal protein S18 acetylase RimI-like enzyme
VEEGALRITRLRRPGPEELRRLEGYDAEAFGPTGLRTYDLAVVAQAGAVLLAWVGNEMVGSCQLLRTVDEPTFLYVVGFYIRPPWQGRGLGRQLVGCVARESRAMGAEGLVLTVSPANVRAYNLYTGVGFVEEDFFPDFYGAGEDRRILRWRFDKSAFTGSV